MELRNLLALDAVLRTGTFAAAARQRHLTQPALWARVKALESEWGLVLFEKAGRRVRPTRAALALRPHVEHTLASARALEGEVDGVRTGRSSAARIACAPHHVSHFLARALAEYRTRHPVAPMPRILTMSFPQAEAALAGGDVDLIVALRSPASVFEAVPLYRVWVAVAHASLGRRRTLEASALRDLPLATVPRELAVRQVVEQTCARAGFAPRVLFEETNVPTLLALARHGVAYAIVSSEALDEAPDVPAARLAERGRPIEREMSLQWRSEASLSPSARQLRDVLCESAARSSGRRRSRRP